jgi:integrase
LGVLVELSAPPTGSASAPRRSWTRNAIAQHVIPPALEEASRQRTEAGLPDIREEVTPHTLRYTCIASLFAAGADQEYVPTRSDMRT